MSAFWNNVRFPFFDMQSLNLDWILNEVKRIAGFMPQDGNSGDFLVRTADGAAWEPLEAIEVNINNLPEDTEIGDNDQLIFYDISAQANRKIKPPNLLNSMMSNGTPLMDGTASPGTSKKPARYDHKHPTDTSRQAALSGAQMNAVNSGAPAGAFTGGILGFAAGGTAQAAPSVLGKTWENPAYITETDFNSIAIEKWGKIVVMDFNTVFASAPSGTFAKIGTIDLGTDTIKNTPNFVVFSTLQSTAKIGIELIADGSIMINSNGEISNTRIRGVFTFMLN